LTLATIAVSLAAVLAAATDTRGAEVGLDRLEVKDVAEGVEIRVLLDRMMRVVAHVPETRGSEVVVRLAPVDPNSDAEDGHESLAWRDGEIPLDEVVYDSTAGEATVTFRFTRVVDFDVAAGPDPHAVVVTLRRGGASPATSGRAARAGVARAGGAAVERTSSDPEPPAPAVRSGRGEVTVEYTIELAVSEQPLDVTTLETPPQLAGRTLYAVTSRDQERVSHSLRLGFFSRRAEAEAAAASLRTQYPEARVERVSPGEHERAAVAAPDLPPISIAEIDRLMMEAQTALENGDNDRAIRLYTKVLEYPEHDQRATAQELLGLARERNRQFAHAKAEYDEYLRRYPEADGADRVRQRLAALVTASKVPETKLRAPKQASAIRSDVYGALSQFYRRDETFTEEGGFTDLSSLFSDLALTGRRRSEAYDLRAQATVGYMRDFVEAKDSELRVSELYLDGLETRYGLSGRAGRQRRSTDGVLGRFDGGVAGWQATKWLRVNALAGLPVEFDDRDEIATDRQLYGLSADLGTFAERLSFNVFGLEQRVDGIEDRRAIGGEARYLDRHLSAFALLDYDMSYDELNIAMLVGTWTFEGGASLNASVDRRLSPILTTMNAIIGQQADSISDLRNIYDEDQLRDLARDRTATSTAGTIGGAVPLTEKYQLAGDVTLASMSDTDASGGVEATEGTGLDLYYSTQLIASGLFRSGDVTVFGMRYSDAGTADDVGVRLSTRFPLGSAWKLSPRLNLDYRWYDDGDQVVVRPSSRLEYRVLRNLQLELDAGGEWLSKEVLDDVEQPWGYFFNVGYRWDF
jgi:hypothetical protein